MSELKIHTQCCYPLFLRRLLPKTCDFYWKQKKSEKKAVQATSGLSSLLSPPKPHRLSSHLAVMSKQLLSISFTTAGFTRTYFLPKILSTGKNLKKKKEAVVEGLVFGAQGWKAQHITASRQHSSSSTGALILLTWSSYFFSFFFFPPPLEGYYFCRPLMCSQRKGLYNTKRENQSWKKGHAITHREACLVQLDLLWLQVVILHFQTAVYLKIK